MYKTTLVDVDGSITLTIPPELLAKLKLAEGSTVGLVAELGRLIVIPVPAST